MYKFEFESLSGGLIKSVSRVVSTNDPMMARRGVVRDYPNLSFDSNPCASYKAIKDGIIILRWDLIK